MSPVRTSRTSEIPLYIDVTMPTKVTEDITNDDSENESSDNESSTEFKDTFQVSVASLMSGQTPTSTKSVIPSPSTRRSKRKQMTSEFATPSPRRSNRKSSVPDDDDDDAVLEKERIASDLKTEMNQNQTSPKKTIQAIEAERDFLQSLFTLVPRVGPTIKWPGWTQGYIKNVTLSDVGKQYYRTKRKSQQLFDDN